MQCLLRNIQFHISHYSSLSITNNDYSLIYLLVIDNEKILRQETSNIVGIL